MALARGEQLKQLPIKLKPKQTSPPIQSNANQTTNVSTLTIPSSFHIDSSWIFKSLNPYTHLTHKTSCWTIHHGKNAQLVFMIYTNRLHNYFFPLLGRWLGHSPWKQCLVALSCLISKFSYFSHFVKKKRQIWAGDWTIHSRNNVQLALNYFHLYSVFSLLSS